MIINLKKLKTLRMLQRLKRLFSKSLVTFLTSLTFLTFLTFILFAQDADLEFSLDVNSPTIPLPKIFQPSIDLSGRGFHRQTSWPQGLAAPEVLDTWGKDIGFSGVYRLQYNLWEVNQLAKDKEVQDKLLSNYEGVIKKITEAGGIVILDIFSTPPGLGKALDKKSPPWDFRAFKELIKNHIRNLSCNKRYNIWYEVWSAPDLDDFFLGRKQEYLNIYRAVAEAAKELSEEFKIYIPVGGPATSWWFQNFDANTIIAPERSLIYELIKFCYHYHLPLNFITWHAYSTDPKVEKETTTYKKTGIALLRDWLTYFNFDRNIPLLVDEWNYDSGANLSPARGERSFVCASYILNRIKNMYEAGIDYQLYFCLEDFQNNKEGVVRNVGVFGFDSEASLYKGAPKSTYNVFRMLSNLGNNMFSASLKPNDEFVDVVATKTQDRIALLIYNYIDPEIARNYLSRNITALSGAERKALLNIITSGRLEKILSHSIEIAKIRASKRLNTLLTRTQELNDRAEKFKSGTRNIKIDIKNLKENYLYQRYTTDSSCSYNCEFTPAEEKEVSASELYQETLVLSPYSVNMVVLKKKPKVPEPVAETASEPSVAQDTSSTNN
ncbi:MAG: hypothetical protein COX40_06250 [Candidatus Omnitrophica bacterium CG23_combo_of_CG06-09_8_20_14_all_40_11]|nr:MAG: hypothetical protein COX40_06250 [Candidatus Omnitrophica bacterium CG23_combo_of_CG06-09_8_20_14_all_40_11]